MNEDKKAVTDSRNVASWECISEAQLRWEIQELEENIQRRKGKEEFDFQS